MPTTPVVTRVFAAGHAAGRAAGLTAALGAALLAAGLTLSPAASASAAASTATITGKVTGADGAPLRHVAVQVVAIAGPTPTFDDVVASTTTAADGTYRLAYDTSLGGDHVKFVPAGATGGTSATGYADLCYGGAPWCSQGGKTFTFQPGKTYTASAALARASVVAVRAVDTRARGVGGMAVSLWPAQVDQLPDSFSAPVYTGTTDADGNARFDRVAPWKSYALCFGTGLGGPEAASPNPDGYVGTCYETGSDRLTTVAGKTASRTATLAGGGGISGTVVDATGAPIAGATVSVPPYGFFDLPSTTTSRKGTFRLGMLAPGRTRWCVDAEGYRSTCVGSDDDPQVTVKPFTTVPVGTVVLQRET